MLRRFFPDCLLLHSKAGLPLLILHYFHFVHLCSVLLRSPKRVFHSLFAPRLFLLDCLLHVDTFLNLLKYLPRQ